MKIDTTLGNPKNRPNKTAYSHDSSVVRHHADDYPTPEAYVWALTDYLGLPRSTVVWDPCAGGGWLVRALERDFDRVLRSDLHYSGDDFLEKAAHYPQWIITNPPYKHAEAFIRQALDNATDGVAMLCNTALLEGIGRSKGLFTEHPPYQILMCNRRMRLPTGTSSTFSHVWLVWGGEAVDPGQLHPRFGWLDLTVYTGDQLVMPTGQAPGVWGE